MFVHRGRLEPALYAKDYVDPAVFERERSAIFATHWHLLGAPPVLAQPGGQVALEVLGVPVVVRNEAGTLVAFRNVCPHRYSLIAAPGEKVADTLRCQYHGWEFRADGRLSQLPDGPSFRGFKARDTCLERLRVERLGPLVFVNLSPAAPPLREAWGPFYGELEDYLNRMRLVVRKRTEHDVNWKIPVENAVESYHVPMVHPETFKNYVPEAEQEHELEPTYSRYRHTGPASTLESLALAGFALMVEPDKRRRYHHVHVMPNYLIACSHLYVEVCEIVPLAVERCRRDAWGFLPIDVRKNPLAKALDVVHERIVLRGAAKILAEDAGIWSAVQAGARHATQRGVLSAREERVYHFQRYVARALGRELQPENDAPFSAKDG